MASALTLPERYRKDGDEFLNNMVRVTGNAWGLIVNVETKEQSKQWMHIHSPNMPKILNNRLP
jgi:hypothetical protein